MSQNAAETGEGADSKRHPAAKPGAKVGATPAVGVAGADVAVVSATGLDVDVALAVVCAVAVVVAVAVGLGTGWHPSKEGAATMSTSVLTLMHFARMSQPMNVLKTVFASCVMCVLILVTCRGSTPNTTLAALSTCRGDEPRAVAVHMPGHVQEFELLIVGEAKHAYFE